MSTELNLAEVGAADYLNPAYLETAASGGGGQFALAMAYHAVNAGVTDAELREVRDAIADANGAGFAGGGDAAAPESVRDSVRHAGARWAENAPELERLFAVAAPLLTTWRAYGAFLLHLDRIQQQVALISGLRKQA